MYCSAHAPPTAVPPENRSLKLCWSCVLEGAVPLPSPLTDEATTTMSFSPTTARGIADHLSPTAATLTASATRGGYVAPQPPSPAHLDHTAGDDEDERQRKKEGGFLSAIVSLIEVVAAPATPVRSRGSPVQGASPAGGNATAAGARRKELEQASMGDIRGRDLSLTLPQAIEGARPPSAFPPRSPARTPTRSSLRRRAPLHPRSPTSSASLARQTRNGGGGRGEAGVPGWRGGWSPLSPASEAAQQTAAFRSGPPKAKLQRGFGSSVSTASSTEPGDEYEMQMRRAAGGTGGGSGSTTNSGVVETGSDLNEKPVELGFPSERPWAYGFGSG